MWPCLQWLGTSGLVTYIQQELNSKSHLVIDSDELSNHIKQILVTKHLWSHQLHHYWVQCSLHLAMLLWCLPLILNMTWDGPMVLRYVCFFTFFLVELIMLADMHTTGWIAAYVKCLPFPFLPNEHPIISYGLLWVSCPCWMLDYSPVWLTPLSLF
jgi:hypothetical protein